MDDPTGLLFGVTISAPWAVALITRGAGFFDGLTEPLGGGTAALRKAIGEDTIDTTSYQYRLAHGIGGLTGTVEAGLASGGLVSDWLEGRDLFEGLGLLTSMGGGGAGSLAEQILDANFQPSLCQAGVSTTLGMYGGGGGWAVAQLFGGSSTADSVAGEIASQILARAL